MPPKSKVRRPSQARSMVTVEAILEAASQVLRRSGLEECSTTRIAERAGVSVGTLYQYFPNKDAVFEALIDRLLARRMEERTRRLAALPDTFDVGPAILALMEDLMESHLSDPILAHQLHRYEVASGLERLDRYHDQMRAVVAAQLRHHADHVRPLDPDLAARILVHAVTGVLERMAREDHTLPNRPEIRREMAALVAGFLTPTNPVALLFPSIGA